MKIELDPEQVDKLFLKELDNLITTPTDHLTHPEDIEVLDAIKHYAAILRKLIAP